MTIFQLNFFRILLLWSSTHSDSQFFCCLILSTTLVAAGKLYQRVLWISKFVIIPYKTKEKENIGKLISKIENVRCMIKWNIWRVYFLQLLSKFGLSAFILFTPILWNYYIFTDMSWIRRTLDKNLTNHAKFRAPHTWNVCKNFKKFQHSWHLNSL